jgi:hypothetical protein
VLDKRVKPDLGQLGPARLGAGEPAVIPPGPDDLLGTRALALNAAGSSFMGLPASWSIGSYAFYGCIRIFISDAEDLFSLVTAGTTVLIYGVGPASTPTAQAAGAEAARAPGRRTGVARTSLHDRAPDDEAGAQLGERRR